MVNVYLVLVFVIFGAVQIIDAKTRKLAPYITPCHLNDPKLNECWIKHGNVALKKLVEGDAANKIRVLHPLKIDELLLQPSPSLKLHLKNVEVHGIENAELKDGDLDLKNMILKNKFAVPRLEVLGQYEVEGKILILPITGNGPVNMTFINPVFDYTIEYTLEEKKSHRVIQFKSHQLDYTVERVYYNLGNLFNGNKQLGDSMLAFLNENWKEIDRELSASFNEVLKTLVKEIILNSLSNVPYEEVLLP